VEVHAETHILLNIGAGISIRKLACGMSEHTEKPSVVPFPSPEGSNKFADPERRGQKRYAFSAAAEVYEPRGQIRVSGRCSDLSPGGCYVDTLSPLPVGSVARVRLVRESQQFEATAVVTYALVSMGMGMKFTEITREHRATLQSWIAELSGVPAPLSAAPPTPSAHKSKAESAEGDANLLIIINELITILVRKKILTENEAAGLLRRLFR
jgi:hypothetical protein